MLINECSNHMTISRCRVAHPSCRTIVSCGITKLFTCFPTRYNRAGAEVQTLTLVVARIHRVTELNYNYHFSTRYSPTIAIGTRERRARD